MAPVFRNGYALLVGVGHYRDHRISDLPATIKDVQELEKVLLDPNRCAYTAENITCLTEEKATAKNILTGLEWLINKAANDPEATTIFYFSGHGWKSKLTPTPHYYLIPQDCDCDSVDTTAIREDQLSSKLNLISAPRLVVLLDACHAGGATKETETLPSGFDKTPLPPKAIFDRLKIGEGRIVISSSKENERSFLRYPDYTHSIFTHHLLEALSGEAHTYSKYEIGVIDLYSYLAATVPTTAEKQIDSFVGGPAQQHPIMDGSKTENFAIALLGGRKGVLTENESSLKNNTLAKQHLEQRKKELEQPLTIYIEQRTALEEDIALAAQDGQKQSILRRRLEKVQADILKIENEIQQIDQKINS